MPRPRKPDGARILYVEIALNNDVRWRIDPRTQTVQEIEEFNGQLMIRGPVRLSAFNAALEAEQRRRHAND